MRSKIMEEKRSEEEKKTVGKMRRDEEYGGGKQKGEDEKEEDDGREIGDDEMGDRIYRQKPGEVGKGETGEKPAGKEEDRGLGQI